MAATARSVADAVSRALAAAAPSFALPLTSLQITVNLGASGVVRSVVVRPELRYEAEPPRPERPATYREARGVSP